MDWLQFISSILIAAMWPAVVIYLLYLLRHQLAALAKRLQEISLPGGGGAKFREEILEAKIELEGLPERRQIRRQSETLAAGEQGPRQVIMDRFFKLEDDMSILISELPLEARKQPSDFIFYDLRGSEKGNILYDTYSRIRDLRSMAFHASDRALNGQDVRDFDDLCASFLDLFKAMIVQYQACKP